jgi:hypothetical protein
MKDLLYIIAIILIVGWAVGYFAYNGAGLIHGLLVIALLLIIIRVISGRKLMD